MKKKCKDFIKFFIISVLLLMALLGLVCFMMWDIHYFSIMTIWRAILIMAAVISVLTILIAPETKN